MTTTLARRFFRTRHFGSWRGVHTARHPCSLPWPALIGRSLDGLILCRATSNPAAKPAPPPPIPTPHRRQSRGHTTQSTLIGLDLFAVPRRADDGPELREARDLPRRAVSQLGRRAAAQRDHRGHQAQNCRVPDWNGREMVCQGRNRRGPGGVLCSRAPYRMPSRMTRRSWAAPCLPPTPAALPPPPDARTQAPGDSGVPPNTPRL